MFGRATIRLGIGPHSSYYYKLSVTGSKHQAETSTGEKQHDFGDTLEKSIFNAYIVFLRNVIVTWWRYNKGNLIITGTVGLCICIYVFNCIFHLIPAFNKSATVQKNVWYRFLVLTTLTHW